MTNEFQPYPLHPRIRALQRLIQRFDKKFYRSIIDGDWDAARALRTKSRDAGQELVRFTEELQKDLAIVPRWVAVGESEPDAFACLGCGSRIGPEDDTCGYCGWSYSTAAEPQP